MGLAPDAEASMLGVLNQRTHSFDPGSVRDDRRQVAAFYHYRRSRTNDKTMKCGKMPGGKVGQVTAPGPKKRAGVPPGRRLKVALPLALESVPKVPAHTDTT